jgi:hypothetical protein
LSFEHQLKTKLALYNRVLERLDPRLPLIPSSNHREWPRESPRRRRPRLSVATPDALESYLTEIEKSEELVRGLLNRDWLTLARRWTDADAGARYAILQEAQAMGELAHFIATYHPRVELEGT